MATPTPENLPSDLRFREFQDNHYHDEDELPGIVPPTDDSTPHRKPNPVYGKKTTPIVPKYRRFEED